ncbi:hypothetical protein [Halotia branconii]|uniref:Uncharacterized protein n=1 Tax=Halotia branconii CENA392 TaxID=1539056 RepID=A0AAJ6NP88_9CYAN|nr:hypothetical protein [Halotia branconii]WGV24067.1 hypothetical protein QI031_19975 [Halotia branconii CENA392]
MKLFNNVLTAVYSPAVIFCIAFIGAVPTNAANLVSTNTSRTAFNQISVPDKTSDITVNGSHTASLQTTKVKDTNNNYVLNSDLDKLIANIQLAQATTAPIRIEAESMTRSVYRLESNSLASGGSMISLAGSSSTEKGTAKTTFSGTAGNYDVVVAYYDENDGVASLAVKIKGSQVDTWSLNQDLGTNYVTNNNRVRRTVATGVTLNSGDVLEIEGTENSGEYARVDYVELIPTSQTTPDPTPTPSSTSWKERILNSDGSINWTEYTNVAQNYHKREMIDYRFGPKYSDFHTTAESFPLVYQPSSDGIIRKNAGSWCRVEPGTDGDPGAAWITSGQMLFSPDADAPAQYRFGSSNMRNSDGAISFTDNGLCLRARAEWTPDWWNRNGISVPITPAVSEYDEASGGTLPLPPIATARGVGGASVTGFLAFQNGLIGIAGTGNDGYSLEGYLNRSVKLDAGKVPTAMTVTNNNEFVLVTVWDTVNRKGQVAVLAVKNRQNAQEKRFYWGLPGWPTVQDLKVIGYIDLPFAAPNAIDVTVSTRLGNPRGNNDNYNDDLNSQSVRNTWYNRQWDDTNNKWKQTAQSGYAIVSSRAENKVALIDLRPLLKYYRQMYLTTQANFDQTKNEGTSANQWPYAFSYAPQQKPVIAKVLTVNQPTSVATGNWWNTAYSPRAERYGEERKPLMIAYIASMDGNVRMYDVQSMIYPNATAAVSDNPFKSFQVGKNPVQMFHGFFSTANDDLFIVSRGDRAIYYAFYNGIINGVLRDSRLKDPVSVGVSIDHAGYGGSGPSKTMYSHVMSVMDFSGKQAVNYMVNDGYNRNGERIPFTGSNGENLIFMHGFSNPVKGNPFMVTFEEVI